MANEGYQTGVCEVHKYALNDTRLRNVFYCSICEAWICDSCNYDIPLRVKAMIIQKKRRIFDNDFS